MSAFEEFLKDNPKMADQPYGAAIAGTLIKWHRQLNELGVRKPLNAGHVDFP